MTRVRSAARALRSPALAGPAALALLALLASGASLANGFVFDDGPIVQLNARVHSLARWWEAFGQAYWPPHWGNTNYRPLTILSFGVQWALGDGSPAVFHAVSVLLYVATSLAVLALARLVLPASAAWVVAALFAVHPVHVEAVANVVGQSELLVALSSVLATTIYVRMRGAGHGLEPRAVAAIGALYAVACFSKETGFLLPGLLFAAECTVVAARLDPARRTLRARAHELGLVYAVCAGVGLGYLSARHAVLGTVADLPNIVLSRLTDGQRLLTMLGVVPEWARLLLWPAKLAADYSPPRIPLILAPTPATIAGVVILGGAVMLVVAGWRLRERVPALGVLWFAVTIFPVSNVLLLSGVLLAERTLFLPSVGAMLALGPLWAWVGARIPRARYVSRRVAAVPVVAALAIVLVLGVTRSASRSRVWRSADTFYGQVVEDAPLSYRAHHLHGAWLFTKGRRAEGEKHLRMAIAMFPDDAGPYTDLADHYRHAGLCAPARDLYRRAVALGTLRDRARMGLVLCLLRDAQYAEAAAQARLGASGGGFQVEEFRRFAATADSAAAAASSIRQAGTARRAQ